MQNRSRNIKHSLLLKAKINKSDEFYTQLADIERELQHYKEHFKNKTVFCNCDFEWSNFVKYFQENFEEFGLKKLLFSGYKKESGKGDFRSSESLELLKQADIIVTNPPFSLFREYVSQLTEHNKKFLIIGNINAITYKDIFSLIKENKAWLGVNLGRGISGFTVPKHYELYGSETAVDKLDNKIISPNNCLWLTNLDNFKRNTDIILTKKYIGNEEFYQKYDNCNGINVNKTLDIPMDYAGLIGVPITFLHKFNPNQFEIIKFRKGDNEKDLSINGKPTYFRILIRSRNPKIKTLQPFR
jgi:hypothetical protein